MKSSAVTLVFIGVVLVVVVVFGFEAVYAQPDRYTYCRSLDSCQVRVEFGETYETVCKLKEGNALCYSNQCFASSTVRYIFSETLKASRRTFYSKGCIAPSDPLLCGSERCYQSLGYCERVICCNNTLYDVDYCNDFITAKPPTVSPDPGTAASFPTTSTIPDDQRLFRTSGHVRGKPLAVWPTTSKKITSSLPTRPNSRDVDPTSKTFATPTNLKSIPAKSCKAIKNCVVRNGTTYETECTPKETNEVCAGKCFTRSVRLSEQHATYMYKKGCWGDDECRDRTCSNDTLFMDSWAVKCCANTGSIDFYNAHLQVVILDNDRSLS